ncbi:NYN domain-containing protein [Cognatiyoonia sp. IB215182]|uniref:NYN domain-containing protein n=1 Tax=Cognatiyoonia sp. IB215182 TaxID=3097353 RepID=UPI002A12157F|nr:hypothetical protein [Cognatiyoonia sp. IB215182]MDX8353876.1 hypothetical protein [Cognatiyoonia sp. IB215182]
MTVLKSLCFGLVVMMVLAAVILPEDAQKAMVIDMIGKGVFVSFGLLFTGYVLRFLRWRSAKPTPQPEVRVSGQAVIVDGANVMTWGGQPSVEVLSKVLKELNYRGLSPVVYFDDEAARKLTGKRMRPAAMAAELGLPQEQIVFAPKRMTADEVLLEHAVNDNLRVVTNDTFGDLAQKFPKVAEAGFLIKGMWKGGNVILLGLGRSSPV